MAGGTRTGTAAVYLLVDPTTDPVNHPAGTVFHVGALPARTHGLDSSSLLWDARKLPDTAARLDDLNAAGVEAVVEILTCPDPDVTESVRCAALVAEALGAVAERRIVVNRYDALWIDRLDAKIPARFPSEWPVLTWVPSSWSAARGTSFGQALAVVEDFRPRSFADQLTAPLSSAARDSGPVLLLVLAGRGIDPDFLHAGLILHAAVLDGMEAVADEAASALARSLTGTVVPDEMVPLTSGTPMVVQS